jgi:hypothetical protein
VFVLYTGHQLRATRVPLTIRWRSIVQDTHASVGRDAPDPMVQHAILQEVLLFFPRTAAQVKVYQCLALKHRLVPGVQRVRCYPFANHTFWNRNIYDTVFFRPPAGLSESGFELPRDRDSLEYGKVLLLFQLRLPGRMGRVREVACAYVKYFDKYLARGECASKPASVSW